MNNWIKKISHVFSIQLKKGVMKEAQYQSPLGYHAIDALISLEADKQILHSFRRRDYAKS